MAKRCPMMDSKAIVDKVLDKVEDKYLAKLPSRKDLRNTVKHIQKAINGERPPVSPKNLRDLGEIPEHYKVIGNNFLLRNWTKIENRTKIENWTKLKI